MDKFELAESIKKLYDKEDFDVQEAYVIADLAADLADLILKEKSEKDDDQTN